MLTNDKLKSVSELVSIVDRLRNRGKKVGLITGCFDVVHIGHLDLFQFAKRNVDVLVVGLDSDESIRISKGDSRPIFKINQRSRMVAELECVDFVFPIELSMNFTNVEANIVHSEILSLIKPHMLFTSMVVDMYLEDKKKRAERFGVKFLPFTPVSSSSSSSTMARIIESLSR